MQRKKFITIFIVIAAVLSAVFVVCNSSVSGKRSYTVTSAISERVAAVTVDGFSEMEEAARKREVKRIDAFVRGVAHAAEFFLFGFFISAFFYYATGVKKPPLVFIAGFLVCAAFALADEFYQIFVPWRVFDLYDAAEDAAGAFFGCLIFAFGVRERKRKFFKQSERRVKTIDKSR